ncbi:cupin domain-containing protein [Mesorhizobium sp.]|uniref:cupin domain-containing protein n=1 Tax=Mesorhizobium sp. TaxID=1871066 RepID=UPI001214BA55|nr:cupin domain-containing protein [Mesorhizobium sp.]TIT00020.1 MAG: cupin domain-containing protein [Mesorhizobium sp.]
MLKLRHTLALCAALSCFAWTDLPRAQENAAAVTDQKPIKRTPLQRFDVPGTAYETVIGIAEIAPNVSVGRHTHPGPESGYIIEGGLDLLIDGEPPRHFAVGQSYQVPPAKVHDARTGPAGAKVIATYVVEKGKPIASPVE